jgi:predicted transcriptional regulator
MSITSVRLQDEVEQDLQAIAGTLHRSKSWLINQAVKEFIDRQKLEQIRWQETLQAMESVAQGHVVSGEAVHTWMKSWGASDELPPPKVGQ